MSLAPGTRVGPYEILAPLAAGGMGEVYRARDIKLNREVALKVLPDAFAFDPDRLARFKREAQVLASLNHPNIAAIYGSEEAAEVQALVLELVEGPTLADRIAHGPIPLDEALTIARQVADALEAAHDQGIIHRDLKPANIKLRPDGAVKVLDFGLAKALEPAPVSAGLSRSPTITSPAMTQLGVILGTAAYMSPEQAQGKPVDKRADIWAFGVVLYEMLSAQRLFTGDTVSDTLAAVLKEEPDWDRVPPRAQPLLRRCLVKDAKRRLRDIGDAMPLFENATESPHARPPWMAWSAPVFLLSSLLLAFIHFREEPPPVPAPVRLQITLPENVTTAGRTLTLSPDGRKLAFSATGPDGIPRVWVRSMDSLEVRELPGTDTRPTPPPFFWSPDSRFIAYSAPEGKLKKVDLAGSPPQLLCDTTGPNATGGAWNSDGVIVFGGSNGGLTRVSETGGTPSPVTALDPSRKETRHAFPMFLADGRRFVYLRTSTVPENSGVYLGSLDAKPEEQDSKQLLMTPFGPVYVPSLERGRGLLLIMRDGGTVLAQAFDERRSQLVGDPIPVVQGVGALIAAGFFSASLNGVLAYRSSGVVQDGRLNWWSRQGYLDTPEQPDGVRALALSPDGARAALVRQDPMNPMNQDIWAWDTTRATRTRMTFDPRRADSPVWSPDGKRLFFRSNREGSWNLHRKLTDESKDDDVLLKSDRDKTPTSISRDERFLLYTQSDPQTKNDVWILSNPNGGQADRKSTPFLQREFDEGEARFSPDSESRWVAYTSNESGRNEVYVREFSPNATGRPWQVSKQGGTNPRWSGDGKELFFAALDETVMAVHVMPGATFQTSAPSGLFKVPSGVLPNWDVTGDGKRFLTLVRVQQNAQTPITVVLNWREGLVK
jgi:serine/threonine protein kinase